MSDPGLHKNNSRLVTPLCRLWHPQPVKCLDLCKPNCWIFGHPGFHIHMSKKKLSHVTPKKLTQKRGRPCKFRLKVEGKGKKNRYIGTEKRMAIALLAEAGKSPSDIVCIIPCNWSTAVTL